MDDIPILAAFYAVSNTDFWYAQLSVCIKRETHVMHNILRTDGQSFLSLQKATTHGKNI